MLSLRLLLTLLDWPLSCPAVHVAMLASFTHTFLNNLLSFGPKLFKCALTREMKTRMILSSFPRLCSFPDRILPRNLPRAPSYSLLPAGCLNTICFWKNLPLTTYLQVWKAFFIFFIICFIVKLHRFFSSPLVSHWQLLENFLTGKGEDNACNT